jgi:hypothetical protein
MRLYSFTNYYLSPLQQGLQTAHCVAEIFSKYAHYSASYKHIDTNIWANHHKTIIILNGGNQESLNGLVSVFADDANPYAWADFHEDEQSLNNCLTCVSIVLPESIYTAAELIRARAGEFYWMDDDTYQLKSTTTDTPPSTITYSEWQVQFINKLNQYRLA